MNARCGTPTFAPRQANEKQAQGKRSRRESVSPASEQIGVTKNVGGLRNFPDSEVIDPLAGLQLRSEPARRLASTCPGFRRPIGIAEFRNDRWIWAPAARRFRALGFDAALELLQAIFEQALLCEQAGCKPRGYFFVERPQLISGH